MTDDNVTPIAPVQECASCGSRHTHAERFRLDAHNDGCMQPEIRFKRAEAQIELLRDGMTKLIEHVEQIERSLERVWRTAALGLGITDPKPLKETHGISEASPDTQRSGSPAALRLDTPDGWAEAVRIGAVSCNSGGAHADARAAEPERSPAAGAEPAGEEPGRP